MKFIIKSILALIMVSSIAQAQQWKLKISLEKKTYVEEANIYLLISLKNISGSIFERNTRIFEFLLKNLDGNNQNDVYEKTGMPGSEMILKTYPGDNFLSVGKLVLNFGFEGSRNFLYKLKTGKYSIRVRYEDILTKNKIDTLRHKFYYSNELTFNIVKPSDKDLILKNKFINIFDQRKTIGFKEATKRYIELIKEYPNNPYVSLIVSYLYVSPTYLFKNEVLKLLNRYPNKYWVSTLYSSLKYKQRKKIIIENKLKGTLLDKFITSNDIEERAVKEYESSHLNYKRNTLQKIRGNK